MNHPLSSRRFVELADLLSETLRKIVEKLEEPTKDGMHTVLLSDSYQTYNYGSQLRCQKWAIGRHIWRLVCDKNCPQTREIRVLMESGWVGMFDAKELDWGPGVSDPMEEMLKLARETEFQWRSHTSNHRYTV